MAESSRTLSEHARSPLLLRLRLGAPQRASAGPVVVVVVVVVVVARAVALRGAHVFAPRALRPRRSTRARRALRPWRPRRPRRPRRSGAS